MNLNILNIANIAQMEPEVEMPIPPALEPAAQIAVSPVTSHSLVGEASLTSSQQPLSEELSLEPVSEPPGMEAPLMFVPAETEQDPAAAPATLQDILDQHLVWLHSDGQAGRQANLSRGTFTGADLTDVNLRDAVLHKAVLKGAELLLTDFQGASLLQADLRGANLLGAKFQDANLQGATLEEATGLQSEQLAGANLFGAALPAQVSVARDLRQVQGLARLNSWLIAAMAVLSGLAAVRAVTTGDAQLLANGSVLPWSGLQGLLPLVPFYLCGPAAMLGLYICLHLCLQRLWDSAAMQPAIFPDGRRLDSCLPWFARWPARSRMKWLREHSPSLASLEAGISMLLLYGMVPAAMVLFWARYLTLQDLRGTLLQVSLVAAAVWAAFYFARAAGRAYKSSSPYPRIGAVWLRRTIAPGLGLLLALLSFGAITGTPHGDRGNSGVQSWAADLLWWAGYTPTAQLAESDVSVKPSNWTGRDEDLAGVEGARMNGLRLRYIQAYGAFFAKARLWQADLSHANLSEADLRQANLRQAILTGVALDHAKLGSAVFLEADLQGANLTQSDLHDANLSRASLVGAQLLDAKLDGANLYGSDLRNAVLQRASLQHADLRDADLEGADLTMAILRQTYLSSAKMAGAKLQGAQLAQAFLTQADLQNADLRGAGLQGAILNGANLTGANLQDVDLRGALGVTAAQVCSAANLRQIQLDDALQHDVESQCGLNH